MVTHIGTRTITTERLILRRFDYLDIDSMIRNWIADEQTHEKMDKVVKRENLNNIYKITPLTCK